MTSNGSLDTRHSSTQRFARWVTRIAVIAVSAIVTIGCVSNPPKSDVVHTLKPGEDLRTVSVKYTGTEDNVKAIAARSGILKLSAVKPGDTITVPAELVGQGDAKPTESATTNSDRARTVGEATATGAVAGAAIGAAACKNNRLMCAAMGAAIGAVGGAIAGTAVAATKDKAITAEERLDREIAAAQKYNKELLAYNTQLAAEIKQLSLQANRLRQQYRQGTVKAAQLTSERKQVAAKVASSEKKLAAARKELERQDANYKELSTGETASNPNTKKLKGEIEQIRSNIAKIEKGSEELASIEDGLSV